MCHTKPRRRGNTWHLRLWIAISYAVAHPYCTVLRHRHEEDDGEPRSPQPVGAAVVASP